MPTMHRLSALCLCSVFLNGCSSTTLEITRVKTPPPPQMGTSETVPGIPFYVKTAGCRHQTVWIQPVYALALAVKVTAEEPAADDSQPTNHPPNTKTTTSTCTYSKVISLGTYNNADHPVQALQSLLSQAGSATDLQRIQNIFAAWDRIVTGTYDPLSLSDDDTITSHDVYLASNTIAPELYVDYGTTYYFNSRKPLAGSSQQTAKLADDGTLTEGTSQVESKTLATFLSLVPFSDVLKTIATGALPFATDQRALQCASPTAVRATYEFDLKITTKALKRTHSAYVLGTDSTLTKPPCGLPVTQVIKPTYTAYNATVEESSAGDGSKDDGNTVKVNGTVVLPKAAGDKTKKE
jgi:hypothetical protein